VRAVVASVWCPADPAAEDGVGFPVVLYTPGLGTTRIENVPLMEDLASRGYVVAVDHS